MSEDEKKLALDRALVYAAMGGQTTIAAILLDAGADVHAAGEHALMLAAQNGQTETVKLLLRAGANPDSEETIMTAWHRAARHGHKETVKALFEWEEQHSAP